MKSPTLAAGLRTAVSRNQIAKVLLEAAGDDDRLIRLMAVNGLQGLSDRDDVRKALEHMAQADPYASEDGRFLVREAATNALQNAPSRPLK
jgi:hypothetical protein